MPTVTTTYHLRGDEIKKKAAYFINRFTRCGISFQKSKQCAVILAEELRVSFEKNYRGTGDKDADDAEYGAKTRVYDELIKAIKAF